MRSIQQQLKEITEVLLSPVASYNEIRMGCHALKDLYCRAVDFNEAEAARQKNIQTKGGDAVSAYIAALCITDMMRTRKFLLGIKEAIEERSKTNSHQPVTILYAGTGPFATLLTSLTPFFGPEQMQWILLEINPLSFGYLQKTIQQFGLEKYITSAEQADAIQYSLPEKYKADILLSETMRSALEKEPQVAIIANLLPQCKQDAILIPQKITIEACLLGNLAADPPAKKILQTLLELDRATTLQIKNCAVVSDGIIVNIPRKQNKNYTRIALTTSVNVFGKHIIDLNESGITLPEPVINIDVIKNYPARLFFKYRMATKPGFDFQLIAGN